MQVTIWILVAMGIFYWYGHGRGWRHWAVNKVWTFHPWITGTRPENGDSGVLPEDFIATDVMLPNLASGVDAATLTEDSVKLYRSIDRQPVAAKRNTTGSGDAIVLQPEQPLELNTAYTFEVTSKVKDTRGAAFRPYTMSFTTAKDVKYSVYPAAFEQVALPNAKGRFTSITIGPDHRLYAATFDMGIVRYPINPDGTLGDAETIDTVAKANGESRLIVGLRFDPASTADNLILWITNSPTSFSGAEDWSSKVAKLSGPKLEHYQDIVVGLPRAVKDHVTMQMDFGPDGALYFSQGSNTGMGAPDRKWGFRPERLLSASILRLDLKQISNPPLNVKTEDGGSYDPFAAGAPLTIYATGIRVGYRVLWHSNGHCYIGINGSAAHGNAPPTPETFRGLHRIDQDLRGPYTGPIVSPIWDVQQTQPDFFIKIKQGAYYGHPNPLRLNMSKTAATPPPTPILLSARSIPSAPNPIATGNRRHSTSAKTFRPTA